MFDKKTKRVDGTRSRLLILACVLVCLVATSAVVTVIVVGHEHTSPTSLLCGSIVGHAQHTDTHTHTFQCMQRTQTHAHTRHTRPRTRVQMKRIRTRQTSDQTGTDNRNARESATVSAARTTILSVAWLPPADRPPPSNSTYRVGTFFSAPLNFTVVIDLLT